MKKKEKLMFKNLELRAETKEGGKKFITGIIPYNSRSLPMWGTTEIIAPTAFNKTLSDGADIRALYNHDDSKLLGSTRNGTLVLDNTETGLICRVELPNTSYADDAFEIINRGDTKNLSFGFIPIKYEDDAKGKTRTLTEVQLLEVSYCVAFPAYPETNSITFIRGFMKRNINIEALNEVLEKDILEDTDKQTIKQTIDSLSGLIKPDEAVTIEPENSTQDKNTSKEDAALIELLIEAELAA